MPDIEITAAVPDALELYKIMEKFAVSKGWQREGKGDGWWWKPNHNDSELADVIDHELHEAQIDQRVDYCPQVFGWDFGSVGDSL